MVAQRKHAKSLLTITEALFRLEAARLKLMYGESSLNSKLFLEQLIHAGLLFFVASSIPMHRLRGHHLILRSSYEGRRRLNSSLTLQLRPSTNDLCPSGRHRLKFSNVAPSRDRMVNKLSTQCLP